MTLRQITILTICVVFPSSAVSQDWRQFLGDQGRGTSQDTVPTKWNKANNMVWSYQLPGKGSSSPIIVGDRVFVTCFKQQRDSISRFVVCVNKKTGKKMWSKEIGANYREDGYRGYITEHGYASNTPVSDGKMLFVFFGKGGVHAFDLDGNKKWSVDIGKGSSNRRWGSAASLVLYRDAVIVNAADEAKAIIALNKSDGKQLWRQETEMLELTYGTPRLASNNNQTDLVISVPSEIWGLNPKNGKLRWFAETPMTGNVSPSVIVDDKTVYSFGGYRSSGSVAVKLGGKDDVTQSHRLWTSRSSSYVATPLLHESNFYWIDDRGVAYCTNAKDGKTVYRQRVQNLKSGRPVYASPVLIGKYIYVVTRRSGTIVYPPGKGFKPIAQNVIRGDDTDFNASPAVSENRLYLRSDKALYCVGKK